MKRARFLNLITAIALMAVAVTGCKKGSKGITQIPPAQSGEIADQRPTPPINAISSGVPLGGDNQAVSSAPSTEGIPLPPPDDISGYPVEDRETFREQTVYFGFDRSTVEQSERAKIEAVAAYLKNQPTTAVQVEGHCDERGTEEYNRALGEKRALATREYLVSLGVEPKRVFTISYGEDKPADPGHDDAAWKKNRRAEFVLRKRN